MRNLPINITCVILPPLQGFTPDGGATQTKVWAKFPRPFGPNSKF